MANIIKSYTDIEQSKKLAEILPFESADMKWFVPADNEGEFIEEISFISYKSEYHLFDKVTDWDDTPYIPCWSLAALLDVLPNNENISTNLSKGGYRISTLEYTNSWFVNYEDETDGLNNCVTSADNPVDACCELILKLNELNLL